MIDRDEIDATSKLLGVNSSTVQRDYLNGWLLAGLFESNLTLRDRLVLKEATPSARHTSPAPGSPGCGRRRPTGLQPGLLLEALNGACRIFQAHTGVQFDLHRNRQVDQGMITNEKVRAVLRDRARQSWWYGDRTTFTGGRRRNR